MCLRDLSVNSRVLQTTQWLRMPEAEDGDFNP